MFPAGVLIDVHPLPREEVHALGKALATYIHLSLGQLDKVIPYLGITLGVELSLEPERLEKIRQLVAELNSLLWKGREPWSIYDEQRSSYSGLLAYNLVQRLLQNEPEIVKSSQQIRRLRELNTEKF